LSSSARPTTSITAETSPAPQRCPTQQLDIAQADRQGAAGNARATFKVVNRSASACFLQGYPGVALVDDSGNHIAEAARSLDSFFGTYAAPKRVLIAPAAQTSFDLTWVNNDPCSGGVRALRASAFAITPPDEFDSMTVAAPWQGSQTLACPGTVEVHPVGSTIAA
jgi:hypothetical protein